MSRGQLTGEDSAHFDALLLAVDQATSSSLLQPDWKANRLCVEGMNKMGKAEVAYEIGDVIRQKLQAPEPRVIILTLHLIDSFINECGQKWHIVMNDKSICDEIVFLSRKYWGKTGSENVAVVDACTDLIQSWGEAFLSHRKQYPNIVDMYLVLRQMGFPFNMNNHKHDNAHQVPSFATQQPHAQPQSRVPPHHQRNPSDPSSVDAAIAASLQASLNLETNHNIATRGHLPPHHPATRGTPTSSTPAGYDSPARLPDIGARSRQGSLGTRYIDSPSNRPINAPGGSTPTTNATSNAATCPINARALMESMRSADNLLRELLAAASSADEIRRNELAADIAAQLQTNQTKINLAVEQCMNDGELVERLFRVNDDSQALVIVYQEIKNGNISLAQGKQRLNLSSRAVSPRGEGIANSAASSSRNHHSPSQAAASLPPPAPPASHHSPNNTRTHNKQMQNGRKDSLEGDLTVITSEADPFAPQAIDALFDTRPSPHSITSNNTHGNSHNNNHHHINDHNKPAHVAPTVLAAARVVVPAGHPLPPVDIPAKALRNVDSDLQSLDGTVIAAAGDPFAPEALDALLGTKKSQQVHQHFPPPQQLGANRPPHSATINYQMHQQYHQPIPANLGYAPGYPQPYPISPHQPHPLGQHMQPIQRQQHPAVVSAIPALQVQVSANRGGSAPNSANGSPSQHQQHQQQHQATTSQPTAAKDPFSPAALDALFSGSTIPVSNSNGANAVHPRITQLQQEVGRNSGPNSGRNSPSGAARQHHQIANSALGSATKPPTNSSSATPRDPFNPEALDAMLGLTPSSNSNPHHHPPHPSNSNTNSHSPRAGHLTAVNNNVTSSRDPFSPEALDALFDPLPSSTKSAPVPHQHPHQHSPHPYHPTHQQQQTPHHHYPQQYPMQQVSPQLSPHGHMMPGYFPTPVMPAMPMPGMMYVAGPNGMVYTAPANIPPPPGYYPIPNNNIHHH